MPPSRRPSALKVATPSRRPSVTEPRESQSAESQSAEEEWIVDGLIPDRDIYSSDDEKHEITISRANSGEEKDSLRPLTPLQLVRSTPRAIPPPNGCTTPFSRSRNSAGEMVVNAEAPVKTPDGRTICAQCVFPADSFPPAYLCPTCAERVEIHLSKSGGK